MSFIEPCRDPVTIRSGCLGVALRDTLHGARRQVTCVHVVDMCCVLSVLCTVCVSLSLSLPARGYRCVIFMPDDQALEKSDLLTTLGVEVHRVKPVAISNPKHYVNLARNYAASCPGGEGWLRWLMSYHLTTGQQTAAARVHHKHRNVAF